MSAQAAAEPTTGGHMTIWEHLAELRSRIFKVAIAVGVGTVAGWFLFPYLLDFLLVPFKDVQGPDAGVIATEPLQAFTLRLQMSLYIGIAVAMPVILWQLWRFITPALYPHEKKYAIPFIGSALLLFGLGAALAYLILVPTLDFLVNIGGSSIEPLYTASSYITLIVWMMLAFGVGFEFPVVIVALELLGVVTPRRLLGWWRLASVIIVILAAVITPSGDPISMTALAIPMLLLYFLSIGVGALVLKLRSRKQRKAESAESAESADTVDADT
jgi:sec-independent protein translocase protein TatC